MPFSVSGIFDFLSVGQRRQASQPDVYPYFSVIRNVFSKNQFLVGNLYLQKQMPATAGAFECAAADLRPFW